MPLITFIIPVRHQDNARDWSLLKINLTQTIRSISNQSCPDWEGIIVANEGADLPELPERFRDVRVTFPPNIMHEQGTASKKEFLEAFRIDKGRRVLKGMLDAHDSRFFMIVDDDDFVSAKIADFVAKNPNANGWTIDRGYIWSDGGKFLLGYNDFSHVCGTSLIIRSELYGLPESFEAADPVWIKDMLGSHVRIPDILQTRGSRLSSLPFRGAIYRIAHKGSHSKSRGLLQKHFFNLSSLRSPLEFISNVTRLRILNNKLKEEFLIE